MVLAIHIIFVLAVGASFEREVVKVGLAGGLCVDSVGGAREEGFIWGFGTSVHF